MEGIHPSSFHPPPSTLTELSKVISLFETYLLILEVNSTKHWTSLRGSKHCIKGNNIICAQKKTKISYLFLFCKIKFHIYFCIVSGQFSVLWSGSCPSFRWRDLSPSPHFLLQKRSWCVKIAQISVQRNIRLDRRDIWIICFLFI